jgi:hypothetical protein
VLAKSGGQWHDVRQHSPWKILMRICAAILAFFAVTLTGCGGSFPAVSNPLAPAITTQPAAQSVMVGQTATFSVVASGTAPFSYQWQKGTAAIAGATSASYITPSTTLADSLSKFQVVVSNSAGSATSNQAVLTVNPVGGTTDVLTYHNDNARTGQNLNETVLTTANVNSAKFGKLAAYTLDGRVDAQPLYTSSVTVPGQGAHNLLVVPTEHDSVYALDADSGAVIWKTSMLKAGEQPSDDRGCSQVSPEIGVTDTPVIDRNHAPNGVVYAVAMSKDGSGYHQRLHALDLALGTELMGGPTEIQATSPGTGDGTNGTDVVFAPGQYKERVGLLLLNGAVYLGWASHCDIRPYTGWIMGYNANTLAQTSVLNVVPNGSEGAIWMAGAGLAADTSGNIYFLDANGDFDSNLTNGFPTNGNFGNAFLKLSTTNGLKVADYFEMDNQLQENSTDQDLGSGGAMLLPDLSDGANIKHLAVGAGKDTNIYVVNRDSMGKFNTSPNNSNIYQELPGALPGGVYSMPAYFNNTVYYGGNGDFIKAFTITKAMLSATPTAQTSNSFVYPGATPSISANGASNGIVWAIENASTAVLHAYDATTLHELYNSNQASGGRDHFGAGNKFMTPTIVNGKVFVAAPTGVAVFGLVP